jgi:hypothetical protein
MLFPFKRRVYWLAFKVYYEYMSSSPAYPIIQFVGNRQFASNS